MESKKPDIIDDGITIIDGVENLNNETVRNKTIDDVVDDIKYILQMLQNINNVVNLNNIVNSKIASKSCCFPKLFKK